MSEDIVDPVLGLLRYDASLDWYEGQILRNGVAVRIFLSMEEADSLDPVLARARQILSRFEEYAAQARDYAAAELLETKNQSWLSRGERELDADDFKSRMSLRNIQFYADGRVVFHHNDGDLFWGHSIEIHMDSEDHFDYADTPG